MEHRTSFTCRVEFCKILIENDINFIDKDDFQVIYEGENLSDEVLKRICENRSFCFNFAVKWTCAFFTLWGVIALFVPSDELLDSGWPWESDY